MEALEETTTSPLALVTGASSGIGFELARQFAEHGFDLIVVADGPDIEQAARSLAHTGVTVFPVQSDLATPEGIEDLYDTIDGLARPIDAAAINAGVGVGGDFRDTDLASELRLIDLNCRGTVHLAKWLVEDMSERGAGRLLFTSSIAALMPGPYEAVYAASKAFVYSFAQALRNELKDSGVSVTALMPGPTETNFFVRAEMEDTKVGASDKDDPADVARQGFEALMDGKDHVVAGSMKTKLQAALVRPLPDTLKAELHRRSAGPGAAAS
jgi:short-subunit dehydrogenase